MASKSVKKLSKPKQEVVVIYVEGGCVQAVKVSRSLKDVEIILHDQDNIDSGDEAPVVPSGLVAIF